VAEDLQLHRTNHVASPFLFLRSAEFRPNWKELFKLHLEPEGVAFRDGRLFWPVSGTNQPQRTFVLNQVSGELLFKPGDAWELKFLESTCLDARVRFRGEITNASVIRAWKKPKATAAPGQVDNFWHGLLTDVEKVRFSDPPTAQVIFSGDARDWQRFDVNVRLTTSGLDSPWGRGTNVTVIARTDPLSGSNDPIRLMLQVGAEKSRTRWADASYLQLKLQIEPSLEYLVPTNASLSLRLVDAQAGWGTARSISINAQSRPEGLATGERRTHLDVAVEGLESRWGSAERFAASADARHGPTNYLPARFEATVLTEVLRTRWHTSQWSRVEGSANLPALSEFNLFRTNWAWIDRITNLPFHVSATVSNAWVGPHALDHALGTIDWKAPEGRVQAEVSSGEAFVSAGVTGRATTREITFTTAASVRPALFAGYLTTNAQRWLAEFDSLRTPSIEGSGRFVLPSWTRPPTNWQADVLPTLQLRGTLAAPSSSFRGIEFTGVVVPFSLTNQLWQLTDLQLNRPEGALRLNARADELTGDFVVDGASGINPLVLRTALTSPGVQRVFREIEVTNLPPRIEARVRGNWRDLSKLYGTANVLATNFSYRGIPVMGCTARLTYSNQWLAILEPVVIRRGERATAAGLGIDIKQMLLHFTNAVGRLSPLAIGQVIGPITRRTIEPYVFELPPDARVEGTVPLGRNDSNAENMRFEIDGGRFHWNVLHFERLKGTVLWRGNRLTLTNITGGWHGGTMEGWADFNFARPRGGSMAFEAIISRGQLKPIVSDFLHGKTNRLEGTISGRIHVTRADVNRLNSWSGHGHIQLHEGLIWDIPIFGLLSPVLNVVMPGLGNSRAKEGKATFVMTNSVVHSKDLEIIANATRLQYDGHVDFDGNVSAKVEAGLMREVPGIGPLISTVLWPVTKLFRTSISGTLEKPKMEPVYVFPKILTLPFLPFRALNEILNPERREPPPEPVPEKK
ncbi:MAG TPA: hypothetical protein VJS65_14970, partial [Verrucomicrobiae bacterium]|nr:hypothetical protein [Verrucomicrobiae bacterium]